MAIRSTNDPSPSCGQLLAGRAVTLVRFYEELYFLAQNVSGMSHSAIINSENITLCRTKTFPSRKPLDRGTVKVFHSPF